MLESINLGLRMSRKEYEQAMPALQLRLYDLERACWQNLRGER